MAREPAREPTPEAAPEAAPASLPATARGCWCLDPGPGSHPHSEPVWCAARWTRPWSEPWPRHRSEPSPEHRPAHQPAPGRWQWRAHQRVRLRDSLRESRRGVVRPAAGGSRRARLPPRGRPRSSLPRGGRRSERCVTARWMARRTSVGVCRRRSRSARVLLRGTRSRRQRAGRRLRWEGRIRVLLMVRLVLAMLLPQWQWLVALVRNTRMSLLGRARAAWRRYQHRYLCRSGYQSGYCSGCRPGCRAGCRAGSRAGCQAGYPTRP
jgi:hypothetical protein